MQAAIIKHPIASTKDVYAIDDTGTNMIDGNLDDAINGISKSGKITSHKICAVNESDAHNPKLFLYHAFIIAVSD